jgi:aconitate hydratase
VLEGEIVHPAIEMTVTPGSRQILDTIFRSGVYQNLVAAGACMLEPVCGLCIGVGQAPVKGEPSIRTFNRNFPGRSGTVGDEVYLCSPATAVATALRGEISDPRDLPGERPEITPASPNPRMDDRQILAPPPPEEAGSIEIVRGRNIVPPPEGEPLPDDLEGYVLIVVEDDVSTGDMAPDGIGMSLWSNIPECAKYMFSQHDPEFYDRALEWGGIIVGGHNYGQGSSREHAAISALYLGVRAVIAKSFARIHRQNLVGQSILPLTFADENDYNKISQGDSWKIENVREAVESGETELVAKDDSGEEIRLKAQLLSCEREVLLASGMLKYLREGSQSG